MLDLACLREDFPILRREVRGKPLVYLDNAATTQKPRAVIAALTEFYERHNANVNRGVHTLGEEATTLMEEAREKVARFIHAPQGRTVIFTRNTTESINLVAQAWGRKFLRDGDEVLLTELEHHSNLVPWQMLAAQRGVQLRFVPIEEDGTLSVDAARRLLGERTRLFAFTAMSNALGTITPVAEFVRLAHERGALALVDAAQWVPHQETDVAAWDCDFLAFSAHKMLGPTGLGVLYGKERWLEAMDPFLGGGGMIQEVWPDRFSPAVLPQKFEAGTPNIAGAAAFGAAVDYLLGVGLKAVRRHELELTARALEVFSGEGAEVYGPRDPARRGAVISFNVADVHPHDVSQIFDSEGIAIRAGHHCCQPLMRRLKVGATARASFYFYNTLEEVAACAGALRKVKDFFKVKTEAER